MMGHIHNMLLRMIERDHGPEAVLRCFDLAGLPGKDYLPEVVYPEAEFRALYNAAKDIYGADDQATQKAFADFFLEVSPQMFPAIFKIAKDARGLLERVPVIHHLWPSAEYSSGFRQKVFLVESTPARLVLRYDSPNRLCYLLVYAAEGVLRYYGERGVVVEKECVRNGAPACVVEVRFLGPQAGEGA